MEGGGGANMDDDVSTIAKSDPVVPCGENACLPVPATAGSSGLPRALSADTDPDPDPALGPRLEVGVGVETAIVSCREAFLLLLLVCAEEE